MIRIAYLIMLISSPVWVFADIFIVTDSGDGIMAVDVSVKGDKIEYTDRGTGMVKSLEKKTVDALIPTVERGKHYDADKVKKYVSRIKRMQAKHKSLVRKLTEILQAWNAYSKGGAGLDDSIKELRQAYDSSERGTKQYKDAVMGLGMVKFKDLQKKYTSQIDGQIEEIRSDYVSYNMKKLEEMAVKPVKDLANYTGFLTLSTDVAEAGKEDIRGKIKEMKEVLRAATYKEVCGKAYGLFSSKRDIDGYITCGSLLTRVKNEVASTEEEKAGIDKRMELLLQHAKKSNPKYSFDYNGYPMTKDDVALYTSMQRYGSRVTFTGTEMNELCMIIPKKAPPEIISLGRSFAVPLRIIFRGAPRKDRTLGLVVMIPSASGPAHEHYYKLDAASIKAGRLDVDLKETFTMLPGGFEVAVNEYGQSAYYVFVAYIDESGDGSNVKLGAACRWPLS